MAKRSLDRGRSTWTLVGLALRIAVGLGLHKDGDGRTFSAFEAEMRRRLYWQILCLTARVSEDRGHGFELGERSFHASKPCNLDDEDFGHDSQHPLNGKIGPTDMTICLLEMDAVHTIWRVNLDFHISGRGRSSLREQEGLVRAYAQRIESTYLANCDVSNQRTRLLYTIGQLWIQKLSLALYYPMHDRNRLQQGQSNAQGLETAVLLFENFERIESDPCSTGLLWHLQTYAPWHAVSVALAEICRQPGGRYANRAWEVIDNQFANWSQRLAGTKERRLWRPIKSLLKKAQMARRRSQEITTSSPNSQSLSTNSAVPHVDMSFSARNAPVSGIKSPDLNGQILENNQITTSQPPDSIAFAPIGAVPDDPTEPQFLRNWDDWNDFTYDVNGLGEVSLPAMSFAGDDDRGFSM